MTVMAGTPFGVVSFVGNTVYLASPEGDLIAEHEIPVLSESANVASMRLHGDFQMRYGTIMGDRCIFMSRLNEDDSFGYAWNVDAPINSEWGGV